MKKTSTIRPVLFSMLIIASLGAYIFVNYTALDVNNSVDPIHTAQKEVQKEDTQNEEDTLFLLDVELLKYVFNKTVSYIPTLI